MLAFVKLGGSLITDKRVESSFRGLVVDRIARELRSALDADAGLRLLVGHGSGSFGHFAASRYRTAEGVRTPEEWRGFAQVATVASELNRLVSRSFLAAGVPVWPIQPSASARCRDGVLVEMVVDPVRQALARGLVPLVYGDVALDETLGGTIVSTEALFFYLAQQFDVASILLLGEVEGVLDGDGRLIPEITPGTFASVQQMLGGSAGVDVTGGMMGKVRLMLSLVLVVSFLTIRIFDGTRPNLLAATLLGRATPGTLIRADTRSSSGEYG